MANYIPVALSSHMINFFNDDTSDLKTLVSWIDERYYDDYLIRKENTGNHNTFTFADFVARFKFIPDLDPQYLIIMNGNEWDELLVWNSRTRVIDVEFLKHRSFMVDFVKNRRTGPNPDKKYYGFYFRGLTEHKKEFIMFKMRWNDYIKRSIEQLFG